MNERMNIATAIRSAMRGRKPSPYPHLYLCSECGTEWVSGGYACTRRCFCGELVEAQENPEYQAQTVFAQAAE